MRKTKTLICFIIFGLGSLAMSVAVLPLLWLFVWNGRNRRLIFAYCIKTSWSFFRWIMESLGLIGVSISNEDQQILSSVSSTIIAANHLSLIDVIIIASLTNRPTGITKGRLSSNMLLRFILSNGFIRNDGGPGELISRSAAAISEGCNLIVFPEGTRGGGKLQRGTAHIALESMADILALKIDMSAPMLRKGRGWRDAGDRRAVYGISIKTRLNPKEIMDPAKNRNINARKITALIEEALGQ